MIKAIKVANKGELMWESIYLRNVRHSEILDKKVMAGVEMKAVQGRGVSARAMNE